MPYHLTCFWGTHVSRNVTAKSGNAATQIDYILFHRAMRRLVTGVKVVPGREVALQHQRLECDTRLDVPRKPKPKSTPRLKFGS